MTDRRTVMTKKIFHEVLIEMLEDHQITEISVTNLCKQANLNRSTFYAHYQTIYDLYEEIESDFLSHMIYFDSGEKPKAVKNSLCQLAKYTRKHERTFQVLMQNGRFNRRCNDTSIKMLEDNNRMKGKESNIRLNLLTSCYTSGINALLSEWLMRYPDISPEEIAEIIYDICSRGME